MSHKDLEPDQTLPCPQPPPVHIPRQECAGKLMMIFELGNVLGELLPSLWAPKYPILLMVVS